MSYPSLICVKMVEEFSKIGATAPVEIITVRGAVGEYIRGGWKIISAQNQKPDITDPGREILVDSVWAPTLPQRMLRWAEDGFLYELLSIGNSEMDKSQLIDYPERVK